MSRSWGTSSEAKEVVLGGEPRGQLRSADAVQGMRAT